MIAATREISAPPERVYAFLSDLRNHWRLERHLVELAHLDADGDGGRVRMKGPLFGRGTVGRVAWEIAPSDNGSRVSLSAKVESAGPVDRGLLALGGTAYLRRVFAHALENLERELQG